MGTSSAVKWEIQTQNRITALPEAVSGDTDYELEAQIGFVLRRATQRHLAIFASHIPALTPTQFAALAKLSDLGPVSQNELGRATAMDSATIKGVVDRLAARSLVSSSRCPDDRRRIIVSLTPEGHARIAALKPLAHRITGETLSPLDETERASLIDLLSRIS